MALNGGSTRFSWHSMEGAQDSHGTQWREHKILMALNGGSTRFSWHSMEGAQGSRGTQWREHKNLMALNRGSTRFLRHSVEGAQEFHGTRWREHKILMALNGGSTRFLRHSVEGAQDSHGTQWRERERIGADVLFYLSMLRYPASANYAALTKPAFQFRTRSQLTCSTSTVCCISEGQLQPVHCLFFLFAKRIELLYHGLNQDLDRWISRQMKFNKINSVVGISRSLSFSSMTSSRHQSSTIQPNSYASRFSGLMSSKQEQNPQDAASSRHKYQPPLQEMPSYSSQLKAALAQKASHEDSDINTRVKKIENFMSDIQQNGFADMLAENTTLLSETTVLKDRIQELEESQETMRARLNELCKVNGVSTVQSDPKRRKRARPL
ncbi:unnamed protein product [Penicillium salamii]|uniref:Uncharacterized protein n=1 Tax=Penicillium salamii TaxID=1612424 RepID=A0A9W4IHH1_9EURO|nr:unnamed protein product [Penicillium salamii]